MWAFFFFLSVVLYISSHNQRVFVTVDSPLPPKKKRNDNIKEKTRNDIFCFIYVFLSREFVVGFEDENE